MKLSRSITNGPSPGPAPASQARARVTSSTRSSWRTCPKLNARKNVPSVADEPLLVEPNLHRIETRRARWNVRTVMHHMGDLLTGPQPPTTTAIKALLRTTFKTQDRTEPPRQTVDSG